MKSLTAPLLYIALLFFFSRSMGGSGRCIMMYPSGIFEQVTGSSMSELQGMILAENRLEKKRLWGKHAMDCWRYPFVVFGLRCKLQTDVLR